MKLKFDSSLEFQKDAINAVVDVFDGQVNAQFRAAVFPHSHFGSLLDAEFGTGNQFSLPDEIVLENVQKIQEANSIRQTSELQGFDFSIEMETGTGKTYVYLRTIFELNKNYGVRKFIIVVPSVAIREGVLKSINVMRDHFRGLYENVPFDHFVYHSSQLGKVRQFAISNQIQIMIINIQAFVKDVPDKFESKMTEDKIRELNVINRENDRMSGRKPIEFIQATRPVVIIDEPQSVDSTSKAKQAIARLKPAVTLRYSATHHNPYNLLYKLDPIKAYDLRLVKRIEVASIRSGDNFNDAYVKLLGMDNRNGIRAQIEIHKDGRNGPKTVRVWVKQGDNLFRKSNERISYQEGYIVQNIDCTPGAEFLELNSGRCLDLGQEIGGLGDDIMKVQIYETVAEHLKKERAFKGKGIKVLSLFFIDRVANYRIYNDDGSTNLGKIGQWFEEAYQELVKRYSTKASVSIDVSKVHGGYFSQDNQGHNKDTRGNTKGDEDTYNLIMRDKERLLDESVPLRFIFTHSALREGWDNPNVFQICTLNETQSNNKKRQEIGRGLRLAVNKYGERVHDEAVNHLTIIANESYDEFAKALQNEIEEDFGIQFGRVEKIAFSKLVMTKADGSKYRIGQQISEKIWNELVSNGYLNAVGDILDTFAPENSFFNFKISQKFSELQFQIIDVMKKRIFQNRVIVPRERRVLNFQKEVHLGKNFAALWDRIKHRTRYRVTFETEDLIDKAAIRIKKLDPINPVRIAKTLVQLEITGAGIDTSTMLAAGSTDVESPENLPDILAFLQKKTELTRRTLFRILKQSERLNEFKINPDAFMTDVAKEISRSLHDLMLEGIQYDKVPGQQWEMSRIEQEAEERIVRYLNNLYKVRNQDKSLFDAIECDSAVEQKFARDLDNHANVQLFVKLPKWFKIDTPIGPYNPDWAFVTRRDKKLYFVTETKGSLDPDERRNKENQKIDCGKKHFEALDVNYKVVTSLSEVVV